MKWIWEDWAIGFIRIYLMKIKTPVHLVIEQYLAVEKSVVAHAASQS